MDAEDKNMSFVLIVEPDELVLQKINDLLAAGECGFDYQVVATPDAAVELLNTKKVDVLVSEINLPIMSGRELFTLTNMISPDTVHVAITNVGKVTETVAFMNECKVRKLIITPFHVVDDVAEPITSALEYKKLKDKVKEEERAFDDNIFQINENYTRMENHFIENSGKYSDAVEIVANLVKVNIEEMEASMLTKEKMTAWYRRLLELYTDTLIQSNGNYSNCCNTLMDKFHAEEENRRFHLYKKSAFEIPAEKMNEITYMLLLLGDAVKRLLAEYNIRVLLEEAEKYYIIRYECDFAKSVNSEGNIMYQETDADYRNCIIKATERFVNIFSYKEVSMTKEHKYIVNIAVAK